MTKTTNKGVYSLNPTQQVMKQGSEQARREHIQHEQSYKGPKETHRPVTADEGVEAVVHEQIGRAHV